LYIGTVLEFHGIKIKVNARDHHPPHVHIEGRGGNARFNLLSREFMESKGFSRSDLDLIREQILIDYDVLYSEWRRFHEDEE
jgi:hypothetical protein